LAGQTQLEGIYEDVYVERSLVRQQECAEEHPWRGAVRL
jgi:hypothetical protein